MTPASIARYTSSSPKYIVSTTTRASGCRRRIALIASWPFIDGSCRSSSVTSGLWRWNCSTASTPLLASATTTMSGCSATMRRVPSRIRRWSSTHMTRTGATAVADGVDERAAWAGLTGLLRWNGNEGFDGGTGPGAADDLETAADTRRALAHRQQAEVLAGLARGQRLVGREAAAVVAHGEAHAILLVVHDDLHLGRVPVADRVGDRFLADPEQLQIHVRRAVRRAPPVDRDRHPHAVGALGALGHVAQRVHHVGRLHAVAAQLQNRLARVAQRVADLAPQPAQLV